MEGGGGERHGNKLMVRTLPMYAQLTGKFCDQGAAGPVVSRIGSAWRIHLG